MSSKYKADLKFPQDNIADIMRELMDRWHLNDESGVPRYVIMTGETLTNARIQSERSNSVIMDYTNRWTIFNIPIAIISTNGAEPNFMELVR